MKVNVPKNKDHDIKYSICKNLCVNLIMYAE